MAHVDEISKAIVAHSQWKADLRQAVKTGHIDTTIEKIRMDSQCFFGKWLDGPALSPEEKASDHYKTAKEHHAEFHRAAARVIELVLADKKNEAEEMMSLGGDYSKISAKLTRTMMDWKKSLG